MYSKSKIHARVFNESYDPSDETLSNPYVTDTFSSVLRKMLDMRLLKVYTKHVYIPKTELNSKYELNLYRAQRWRGCDDPIDKSKDNNMWPLITNLCGGNNDEAMHLLYFLADLIQPPEMLRRNAHAFVSKHGAGKGIFAMFISRLIGYSNVNTVDDLRKYFNDSFNFSTYDKLLRVFEEVQSSGNQSTQFSDPFKNEITKERTVVKQKYQTDCVHENYCRIFTFSNHLGSIYLEMADRRWTVHNALDGSYIKNRIFSNPILEKLRNDDFIAGCYAYLSKLKYDIVDVEHPYVNKTKKMLEQRSEPKKIQFVK